VTLSQFTEHSTVKPDRQIRTVQVNEYKNGDIHLTTKL